MAASCAQHVSTEGVAVVAFGLIAAMVRTADAAASQQVQSAATASMAGALLSMCARKAQQTQ